MARQNNFKKRNRWNGLTDSPVKAVVMVLVLGAAGFAAIHFSSAQTLEPEALVTSQDVADSQIIVRYKQDADVGKVDAHIESVGANETDEIDNLRIKVLKVPAGERDETIEKLKSDPNYEFVSKDQIVHGDVTTPNDPDYVNGKQLIWPTTMTDIAWDTTKGSPITVAIVDTGVNKTHPELVGKILAGIDYVNNDNDPTDDFGHGSAVASVIAANTNDGVGIAGGCWNCKILPIKALDSKNSGLTSNIAKGVQYAADHNAKIINLSLSSAVDDPAMKTAIDYAISKGAIVVVTAGNTGKSEVRYPAAYPNVITVAATDKEDMLTSYSTFGSHVDIAAYGHVRAAAFNGNGYVELDGTSFAAPAIASMIALLWSAYPNATPAQVRAALLNTTDSCCANNIGGGRVNSARALAYLAGNGNVVDKTSPTINVTSPAEGTSVTAGTILSLTANSLDNVGIGKITFRYDDISPNIFAGPNLSFNLNTTSLPLGPHKITYKAYDKSGNVSAAVVRNFTVTAATTTPPPPPPPATPTVSLSAPAANATISGDTVVTATTANTVSVQFKVDGVNLGSADTTAPYTLTWRTTSSSNGVHKLSAVATSSSGATATSAVVSVTVSNTTTTPPPPPPVQPPTPPVLPPPPPPPPVQPPTPPPAPVKTGDLDGDTKVNLRDLSILLSSWNKSGTVVGDLNKNGRVDLADLSILLSRWNK